MTLIEIQAASDFVKEFVGGFSRPVEQYIRKDGRQVIQVCKLTGQYRVSPVGADDNEIVSCNEADWERLDP